MKLNTKLANGIYIIGEDFEKVVAVKQIWKELKIWRKGYNVHGK